MASIKSPLVFAGVKEGGILVANIIEEVDKNIGEKLSRVGKVDAETIALQEIGIPAVNTVMLGAFAATTEWVSLDSVLEAVERYFKGELLGKNLASAKRGFNEVRMDEL